MVMELDHTVRGGEILTPHKWNDCIALCEYGKAPTRQSHRNTHCCLWSGPPENKVYLIGAVIHEQERRHIVPKSVLRVVLGRMQFTLHATRRTPHGASRLVQAMSAWLVKTRCAPSRHSRDARVYGNTTTAMHKLSTPPPRPNT